MITKREIVFRTPWLQVEAKSTDADAEPFYSLKVPDYVAVIPYTPDGRVVLVRQFRHAVEEMSLEFPSGLVDAGEEPEATARRELEEETGYRAGDVQYLGTLWTDTGRLQNRMWVYRASDVRPVPGAAAEFELMLVEPADLDRAVVEGKFKLALHLAMLALADRQRR
jgi:ADP-ribose pyrophosphatase